MAGISRKELKQDGLVLEVTKTVDFVQTHRQNLIVGAIVAALVIAVGGGGYLFYTKRSDAANLALGNALRTYHSPVRAASLSDTPEDLVFATDKERQDRSIKEFQAVADKYGMMRAGKMASYYVGLCQLNLGNLPEAEKLLNAAVSNGDNFVEPLARLALAGAYARDKKNSDAETTYRYLVDHPTDSVPKQTAQLALAEFLTATKPAEAEKIYKDLESSKPSPEVAELIRKARGGDKAQ